jgi:DNA primase
MSGTSRGTCTSSQLTVQEQFALVERLTIWYTSCLHESEASEARAYLEGRSFSPETLTDFRIGYAPKDFTMEVAEQELAQLEAWDYLKRLPDGTIHHNYEHRIMFPVLDVQGRPRGFSGRSVGSSNAIKYYNSAESSMFRKAELLFGFDRARRSVYLNNKAIVCEGFTDVMAFHQSGSPIAVACMGIAMTEQHLLQLMRYTDTCIFAFDPDKAGMRALAKSIALCKKFGISYGEFKLPDGKDPAAHLLGEGN